MKAFKENWKKWKELLRRKTGQENPAEAGFEAETERSESASSTSIEREDGNGYDIVRVSEPGRSDDARLFRARLEYYANAAKRKIRLPEVDAFRSQEMFSLAVIAVILAAGFSSLAFFEKRPLPESGIRESEVETAAVFTSPFDTIDIAAKSAVVWDARTGETLYERNPDVVRPLASITKIVTALTAVDLLPRTAIITIRPEFLSEEGDTGLYADESWRFKDLLDYSLIVSSNDGASAIASVAGSMIDDAPYAMGKAEFIGKMNEKAQEIGLLHTYFNNATGLDANAELSGGYGTAKDMAKLFEYALKNYPEVLEATKYGRIQITSLSNIRHVGSNTNEDVNRIPGLIASKTGYTDLSGGNLVVALNAGVNRPIVISVLGSTYEGRFEDVEKLAEATLEFLAGETSESPQESGNQLGG